MRIDLDGFSRVRWVALLGLGLATGCGNRGGGDAAPAATAAPTMNIGGIGQSPGGGLGAVPGGLAGPQGQPGNGSPGVTPPVPPGGGNPGSGQPGGPSISIGDVARHLLPSSRTRSTSSSPE